MSEKIIVCYQCTKHIDIQGKADFDKVSCQDCGNVMVVPKTVGKFILTDKVLETENYICYKGYTDNFPDHLAIKELKVSDSFSEVELGKVENKVNSLNANEGVAYQSFEAEGSYLIVRPWINLSLGGYLKEKRPRLEQALLFLNELSSRFAQAASKEKYLCGVGIHNIYLSEQGKVIIADRGFGAIATGSFEESLLCFKSISSQLCCNAQFSEGITSSLNLRDENPQYLEDFLHKLFSRDSFKSFDEISNALVKLGKTDLDPVASENLEDSAVHVSPETVLDVTQNKAANSPSLKKKANKKGASVSISKGGRRPAGRRKAKKQGSALGILVFVLLLGAGATFFILNNSKKTEEAAPVAKIEPVEKKKKVEKKEKPKPVEKVVEQVEIKAVEIEKPKEVVAIKGSIEHSTFTEIINSKCIDCHGREGKEVEGKFDFVKFLASSKLNMKAWKIIYDQIDKGEMPPEDEEPLTENEKMIVLSEIKKITSSSQITRLTRPLTPNEIKNTLVDLFDIDTGMYNPFTPLYANYSQDKFFTMQQNIITPFYLDDLYQTLHDTLKSYVALNPQIDPLNLKTEFPREIHLSEKFGSKTDLRWGRKEIDFVQVNFENRDAPKEKTSRSSRDVGPDSKIEDTLAKLSLPPGTYKLSFNAQALNMNESRYNESKYGKAIISTFKNILKNHEYSLPVEFYQVPPNQADPHARTKMITTLEVTSSESSRYTIEFTLNRRNGIGFRFPIGLIPNDNSMAKMIAQHKFGNTERKSIEKVYDTLMRTPKYEFPQIRFTNISIKGPFKVQVSDYSVSKAEKLDNLTIRKKFKKLHEDNFIQNNIPYDYVFGKFKQRKIDPEESYRNALISFFLSPDFLTLEYNNKDKRKQARMLSYIFHKSYPKADMQEMLGSVKNKNTSEFTQWLVKHEKFEEFVDNFSYQWLKMDEIKNAMPDERKFSSFYSRNLLENFSLELKHFITHLFKENRPVHELISADYSFVNNDLAKFYGAGNAGEGFSKQKLNSDMRGGILASGAFLTATGNGVDPLPIKRATWILENLLDSHLPPPPDEIELDTFQKDLSKPLHERLKVHSSNEKCYACHKKIDPLAVVMNQFDTIGGQNYGHTQPSISLNDVTVKSFKDLKKYLSTQEELIARSFVKNILKYALGRELYVQDGQIVDEIIKKHAEKNFPVRDMLDSILQNYFF